MVATLAFHTIVDSNEYCLSGHGFSKYIFDRPSPLLSTHTHPSPQYLRPETSILYSQLRITTMKFPILLLGLITAGATAVPLPLSSMDPAVIILEARTGSIL